MVSVTNLDPPDVHITAHTGKLNRLGHNIKGEWMPSAATSNYSVRFSDKDNWVARANRKPRIVTRTKGYDYV